jgi:putative acetyltransferase
MEIRLAKPTDSGAAVGVVRTVYDEYKFTWDESDYHADLYDLDAAYLSQGSPFWIAELDSDPVGTVALEMFPVIPGEMGNVAELNGKVRLSGCDCALNRLYVKSGARGHGIGTALFQKVIETANEKSRLCMEIWSDKRFKEAHRLYQRMGAEIVGDRICDDPDVSPEWGLILRLDINH